LDIKKDILWRVYLVYICVCLFAIFIVARVAVIQFAEGEYWRSYADSLRLKEINIEAARGNIFAADGSLLATSVPFYEVAIDVTTDYLTDERFDAPADTLAEMLSLMFGDRSKREYRQLLDHARSSKDKYTILKRNVSYKQLQEMKKFPILRHGRNRGGFIYNQTNRRERPFRMLAARTIGYDRDSIAVGLEAGYREYLRGTDGKRLMKKIAGGVWMPLRDQNEIEPQDGADLITTIDINIQDVATNALMQSLIKHKAAYGCVVLMEVKTGEVKAIANLTRKDSTRYEEDFNYAIGAATESGSTFKLASMLAVMEDYNVKLTDKVEVGEGVQKFFDRTMKDSHKPDKPVMTVQEVFEISSNVGVAKLITKYYSKSPQQFVDRLYAMNVSGKLGISIPGEGNIRIKNTSDKDWSGVTLPWMSIGYESLITPLKTLTLYNAVANDGRMVRPMFVKEIRKHGKTIKKFETEILNPSICSKETIAKARKMMEGVVQNGTARTLKAATYEVAGKTGTALVAQNGIYKPIAGRANYQASFVGYFPADNPKYSCIVIVNAPSGDAYYGGAVAGPIFKEIADKVYSSSLDIHQEINRVDVQYAKKVPEVKSGYQPEIRQVLAALKVRNESSGSGAWVNTSSRDSISLKLSPSKVEVDLRNGLVPNVVGMTVRDALYLLENHGMNVKIKGSGVISRQSLQAGSRYTKGTQITLELS
jgi:cell division protein FtsI (penicillin-binding protein 3)